MRELEVRKRRAAVFENDIVVMGLLKMFLSLRGYDIFAYDEPVVCPISSGKENCDLLLPCADIEIVDYSLSAMTGLELLNSQDRRKCKLDSKNKALLSGYFDKVNKSDLASLGCANFEKPLNFTELASWFDDCEARMNLSQPLGSIRKEERLSCHVPIIFHTFHTVGIRKGIALNSSPSGLCLKISSPLRPHQTLTIRTNGSTESQSAMVRWIKPLDPNSYVAGLLFQKEEQRPFKTV
jgi:hypothetical protein